MAIDPPFCGEPCELGSARAVLVPVPYERTTTYRKGTARGPMALLRASTQVELHDAETRTGPLSAGVATLDPVVCEGMPDTLAARLEELVGAQMDARRLVGCLGGEHSLSLGPIRAAAKRHPGMGVLQIDAHPDLRDEYEGTRFGHGSVMRRVTEDRNVGRIVQVGLRAVSPEDASAHRELGPERVVPIHAFEMARRGADHWIAEAVALLPGRFYLSFDLDGLDPSVIPGTGTPEPGGLAWWEALALLREAIEQREMVGFDVVELLPEPPSAVSDFAAAKLVFKILAYAFRDRSP